MRFRTILLVTLTVIVTLLPSPARAGGWETWIDLKGDHLGIGETLIVKSEVRFRDLPTAKWANTMEFRAYLVRGVDTQRLEWARGRPEPKRWWTPPTEMIHIGDVELDGWDGNIARAIATISVPEITPGPYNLMFCDAGCRTPVGNLIPLKVEVIPDALVALNARRLDTLTERLELALSRLRSDVRDVHRRVRATKEADAQQAEAIGRLQDKVASIETGSPAIPWVAFAGWFVAGLAVAFSATQLRRRVRRVLPEAPVERVPGEERERVLSR